MATQTKLIKFDRKIFTNLLTCAGYTLRDFAVDLEIDDYKKLEKDLFTTGVTEKDAIRIYGDLFRILSETRDGCAKCMHCDDLKKIYLINDTSVTDNSNQKSWLEFAVKTSEEAFKYLQEATNEEDISWSLMFPDCTGKSGAVGHGQITFIGNNEKPIKHLGTRTITITVVYIRG